MHYICLIFFDLGIFFLSVNWAHEATQFLNCRQMGIPFHYLGIPIGVKSSSQVVWEPLKLNSLNGIRKAYLWLAGSL